MSADRDLAALAAAHGVLPEFRDLSGQTQQTSPETMRALLAANGVPSGSEAEVAEALRATRAGQASRRYPREIVVAGGLPCRIPLVEEADWRLDPEAEAETPLSGRSAGEIALPALPCGVHRLSIGAAPDEEAIRIVAAPPRCPSLASALGRRRCWGATAALYGLRAPGNGGVGSFGDLARLAEIFGEAGAAFLGINPVHSIGWAAAETISPYSPTHRGFLNTAHIAVEDQHGPPAQGPEIDYAAFHAWHRPLLEERFRSACQDDPSFRAFREQRGEALETFAVYEALSEVHGDDWRAWPDRLRNRDGRAVADAAREHSDRCRFHMGLQWLADEQLGAAQARARQAGMGLGLYLDLAVGPRRGGAESWCEQEATALGVSLGAPPDHLSPDGQNWQLAAFSPARLAEQDYAPLRRILRETMRHAGIVRIDHVLGLNRSYWIPDDGSPGGYIKQPFETLLAIVAIEAERSGTVIIGEDLGLVPEGFREALGERGFYSYSVLQYEKDARGRFRAPEDLRRDSLVCFGTHDTPTLRGFCEGRDIEWWHRLGWIDTEEQAAAKARRVDEVSALAALAAEDAASPDPSGVRNGVHRAMADSDVAMVSVQLDDLTGQVEAQNLPGTIDAHPNWRRRCPVALDQIETELDLAALGRMMERAGRRSGACALGKEGEPT